MHGWFGDHLFNRRLWILDRDGVSRALFWGCLICFSPFFGLHFVMGIVAAMVFRANIPMTLLIQVITNPATVIIYYPAAYVLGARLLGEPVLYRKQLMHVLRHGGWEDKLDMMYQIGSPLILGCLLVGLVTGLIGWALVRIFWQQTPVGPAARGKTAKVD